MPPPEKLNVTSPEGESVSENSTASRLRTAFLRGRVQMAALAGKHPFEAQGGAAAAVFRRIGLRAFPVESVERDDDPFFLRPPHDFGCLDHGILYVRRHHLEILSARADFPVVSGNVSLYNETNGQAILPTPSIGGVGLIEDFTQAATLAFKWGGEAILLIGETVGWLGQSLYLRDISGREEGAPPPVDLTEERENGDFVRALVLEGVATAAHDLSDGGLLVALAEMAMASGIGATLTAAPTDLPAHAYWFGEDQARYLVTVPAAQAQGVLARAQQAGVLAASIGVTGGEALTLVGERPMTSQCSRSVSKAGCRATWLALKAQGPRRRNDGTSRQAMNRAAGPLLRVHR